MEAVESKCPECGGAAVEVTDSSDSQRWFICGGVTTAFGIVAESCTHIWGEPFPEIDEQPGEHGWKP